MIGCCDLCERSEYLHMFSPQNCKAFYLCMNCWHEMKTEGEKREETDGELCD